MLNRPNILFLTVDALRADRMSLHGYKRPTTPNIDALSKQGIVYDQAFSLAAFTQASFPAILTSSRPLSHGGYDEGGFNRPPSVFRQFSEAGYKVSTLSSFKWVSHFFGFTDGTHNETHLFLPNDLVGAAINRMKNSLKEFHKGTSAAQETLLSVTPIITDLFDQLDSYCDKRLATARSDNALFKETRFVRSGYNFRKLKRIVARHRSALDNNAEQYLHQHLNFIPKSHQWIAAEWRFARTPFATLRHGLSWAKSFLLGGQNSDKSVVRHNRYKQFVDGSALANQVIQTIKEHDGSSPFFIWTHFLDTHYPYLPGHGKHWYKEAPEYLRRLGYDGKANLATALRGRPKTPEEWNDWNSLYDGAVLYVDEQIGRIVQALEETGLRENTLIVICGDHGEELGEHGNISHYFRLYDHNVHIPLVFSHPHLKVGRSASLVSLMDIAPTLTDVTGIPTPPQWDGMTVFDASVPNRKHIVLETFYGGNCLFDRRPLYMAVRTATHKFLWKEYMDPDDVFGPEGNELYDLTNDPDEQHNLYRKDHPLVTEFEPLLAARMAELKEISRERVEKAFGQVAQKLFEKMDFVS